MKPDQPSHESYRAAAWVLACELAAIRAVAEVEAGPLGAFNDDDSPVILFEPHVFHRLTRGRFEGRKAAGITGPAAELSYAKWRGPGSYGSNADQHKRLAAAALLDRDAALKSASFGLFQVLGESHARAGFPLVQSFVNAMYASADDHLRAFVMFVLKDPLLVTALREHDWRTFKTRYNGPGENDYAARMAAAYERLKETA